MEFGAPSPLLLVILLALSACASQDGDPVVNSATAQSTETDRLNAWFEQKYEEQLQFSPMQLTALGRKEQYDRIDDTSEAAEDEQLEWSTAAVAELNSSFDYRRLSEDAKLSYDIWMYQHERDLAAHAFRDQHYVFDQMNGAQAFFPTFLINFHRVDTEADMLAYISRIGGIGDALLNLLGRTQRYAKGGVRPPQFAYKGVIEQSKKVIAGAPFDSQAKMDSAIWADAKIKIAALAKGQAITANRSTELEALAKSALLKSFAPAYLALIDWFGADMANADKKGSGVSNLPRGKAYYEERLSYSTTTDMSATQVHELGLAEVARLRADMLAVMQQVNFKGDLQAFFEYVRTNERFYFPNTDAGRQRYLDEADAKIEQIRQQLPNYFGLLPKGGLVVKRVEAFRERDGAAQHYNAGTPDGSRPGVYYVHLSDMTAMPTNQLEVIAYHEGLPGHHMQIAIAQELQGVPSFRTQISFTAYVEGWALYSEWLAQEMGAYADPYANFGRITSELWRAIRLVVDTGLHAKGWTEQQTIDYFSANSPEPLASIVSEVQRYIVMPGQATSYKIGMLKILELRQRAQAALGEAFDVRGFHDAILGGGALPMSLLERRIDNWIATQG